MLTGSVCVAFGRMRRTMAADWRARALALADPPAGWPRSTGSSRSSGRGSTSSSGRGSGSPRSAGGASSAGSTRERRDLAAAPRPARREPIADPRPAVPRRPDPDLHRAVREAVRDGPRAGRGRLPARPADGRDHHPRDGPGRPPNVARLRELFGDRFLHFFHILDPLEPGIVVGKSSAMAYGGRWLYRELVAARVRPGATSSSPTSTRTTGSTRSTSAT